MNCIRQNAACTVFKGKIVLTGGHDGKNSLRSVEAYDYNENKWDFLPCMINGRSLHGAVCMGNKLFVIGGKCNATCEVSDSSSIKFTFIKQLKINIFEYVSAVCVGDNLLVRGSSDGLRKKRILTYSVDKNEWHLESDVFFDFGGSICLSKLSFV